MLIRRVLGPENSEGSSGTEDKPVVNKEYEKSAVWHSGLEDVCESSALISPEAEVAKASEVLLRLREGSEKQDTSVSEQIRELETLKQHYCNLEDQIFSQPLGTKNMAAPKDKTQEDQEAREDKENGHHVERPTDLPLDSSLLQEDRLALLIEREVQRRVLEEVVARESAALSSRTNARRNYRSMSTSVDPWNLGLRVLTPSEVRPYTSMSAGYEMEGEVGNHLYQSATSADDLLLTPAPLQSPMTDYDMSCGICVCIPGYEMRGAGSAAHWEYEVKIAAGNDSWTVFRRYRRFRELHMYMCHKYGQPFIFSGGRTLLSTTEVIWQLHRKGCSRA
ncbi:uncharacterized protein LOC119582068 [Penaeus monodon]|uniref:uncharacterized protein LOC119582068 n=1 Tax=Penaeus monodon TaxID=6687 RepID=UPI0018A7684C|nr:uncharacterized protein LOC119582068 [Penaeus monodon]